MRRMWAASAAIVMCLALGGVPVVAQSPGTPDLATWVTGTMTCAVDTVSDPGAESDANGVASVRERLATCTATMSDPRVSGVGPHVYNHDCRSGVCVSWGTYETIGKDGTWIGPWTGMQYPDGPLQAWGVYTGTGAYAGWTYLALATCSDCAAGIVIEGEIYQGPPPPFGPMPSPAGK